MVVIIPINRLCDIVALEVGPAMHSWLAGEFNISGRIEHDAKSWRQHAEGKTIERALRSKCRIFLFVSCVCKIVNDEMDLTYGVHDQMWYQFEFNGMCRYRYSIIGCRRLALTVGISYSTSKLVWEIYLRFGGTSEKCDCVRWYNWEYFSKLKLSMLNHKVPEVWYMLCVGVFKRPANTTNKILIFFY